MVGEDFVVDFAARATRRIPKVAGLRGFGTGSVDTHWAAYGAGLPPCSPRSRSNLSPTERREGATFQPSLA